MGSKMNAMIMTRRTLKLAGLLVLAAVCVHSQHRRRLPSRFTSKYYTQRRRLPNTMRTGSSEDGPQSPTAIPKVTQLEFNGRKLTVTEDEKAKLLPIAWKKLKTAVDDVQTELKAKGPAYYSRSQNLPKAYSDVFQLRDEVDGV